MLLLHASQGCKVIFTLKKKKKLNKKNSGCSTINTKTSSVIYLSFEMCSVEDES